jgi:hypothetical protein
MYNATRLDENLFNKTRSHPSMEHPKGKRMTNQISLDEFKQLDNRKKQSTVYYAEAESNELCKDSQKMLI